LVCIALFLILIGCIGCLSENRIPVPQSQPVPPPPKKVFVEYNACSEIKGLGEVDSLVRNRNIKEALQKLKVLLQDPDTKCEAALYLFALDKYNKNIIKILHSQECMDEQPVQSRLFYKILKLKQELARKNTDIKKKHDYATELEDELVLLEQENARLRFELQKLEEIRRETERWRFK